ncbi:mechanosensitive ion channel domain-containing protein [Maribellus sp. YY47]|uniref:mechanosensitive ion channel family protein n=1 Tax=Maribellus sp. YY47 TaxID=2929486 RepID=UPI002000C10D|nr:mechanosensitive ion channel domain-containing protein [Maribellus sp. YY47]MCK3684418.1 mechanosensitive ion channel family protein [Maribellus sp. YY47]
MLRIFLVILLTVGSLSVFAQTANSPELKDPQMSSTSHFGYVVFNRDTLLTIRTSLGPFSPVERASAIDKKLLLIEDEPRISIDSLHIVSSENYSIIIYKDISILSVTDDDAAAIGKERNDLAAETFAVVKEALVKIGKTKSIVFWILRIFYTLLAVAGLFLIYKLTNRFFRWLTGYVEHYQNDIKEKHKSFWRYLAPKGPDSFFAFLLKISKIAVLIVILLLYMPLMFSFLPWTRGIVTDFYVFISDPLKDILLGLWEFISKKLVFIVLIIFISKYLLRVIYYISSELETGKLKFKGFHQDWAKPTYNIVRILVIAFTLVFIWPYIPGSDSPAFKGVSIFLGVLFSLGSTSAIANIVAGIVITYMRPFQIGDRVKIGETVGDIVEKNLLVTRMTTIKNEDVTIPNSTIINTHLMNFTKNASKLGIILHPTVTIGYDVPSDTVIKLLLAAAKNTPNLTREFKPFVLQKSLSDFYVEYELNVYTKQPGKMAFFYSELYKSILNEFNKAGVEIMSPHYTAYRDGNKSTIPEQQPEQPVKGPDPVTNIIDKITKKD